KKPGIQKLTPSSSARALPVAPAKATNKVKHAVPKRWAKDCRLLSFGVMSVPRLRSPFRSRQKHFRSKAKRLRRITSLNLLVFLIDSIAAWRAGHRLPQDIDQSQKFTSTSEVIDSIGLIRCQKR